MQTPWFRDHPGSCSSFLPSFLHSLIFPPDPARGEGKHGDAPISVSSRVVPPGFVKIEDLCHKYMQQEN